MLLSGILSLEYTNEMSYNRLVVKNLSAEDTMKKILLSILGIVMCLTLFGCQNAGSQYKNIETEKSVSFDSVKVSDYKDNLDGLEKYFIALNYIPKDTEPMDMLANIIGAKKGHKFTFTVNGSYTIMELYEYDPNEMNDDAKRVFKEVEKDGSFHVFGKEDIDKDITYNATISDNRKYLMIYTDGSGADANVQRTKDVISAFEAFHAN